MSSRTLKLSDADRHQVSETLTRDQDIESSKSRLERSSRRGLESEYPEWMDLKTITRYAAVSERTIREWIHRAATSLPAVRVGTKILVNRSVFNDWLKAHPLSPAGTIDVGAVAKQIITELAG
jgi:excisionase family DNA binding protein